MNPLPPCSTGNAASSVDAALVAVPTGEGLMFLKQLLLLMTHLAHSSSSAIATSTNEVCAALPTARSLANMISNSLIDSICTQLEVSHRLLLVMVGELSNSAVCTELLGEVQYTSVCRAS